MIDKAQDVASDARQGAQDAVATEWTYAKDAVNTTGKKIDDVKSPLSQTTDYVTKAIQNDPMKAVFITAVVISLIAALLIATLRSESRYY